MYTTIWIDSIFYYLSTVFTNVFQECHSTYTLPGKSYIFFKINQVAQISSVCQDFRMQRERERGLLHGKIPTQVLL
jgi:hypothetical protein